MIRSRIAHEKSLNTLRPNIISPWKSGITMMIMFRAHPKSELSKFINAYKSASSRLIKKEYPEIRQKLWKEMFWSQSFCLLSAGGAPIEVIRQYIETQGEKKHERSIPVSDLSQ